MAKHNYYPETLKIQIVERLLSGESGSSLREEFNIPSRGTIYGVTGTSIQKIAVENRTTTGQLS